MNMLPAIDAYIICWNEEKIIRHTLNHYAGFCRQITLLNNFSTDSTVALAHKYYPSVKVIDYDTNNETRDDILQEIKNNCWKQSTADYVIVCDTDEFLYAGDMRRQLEMLYEHNVALPLVMGYNMGSETFPDNFDIPIYEQVKYGVRERLFDKQIIFSPRYVAEINYALGCHECRPILKEEKMRDLAIEFKLLHFKYLGKEYLYEKHEAYANRLSLFNIRTSVGSHYLDRQHIDRCFSQLDKHLYKVI